MATGFTATEDPLDVQISFHQDFTRDALCIYIWRRGTKGATTCLGMNGEWKMVAEGSNMEPAVELTMIDRQNFLGKVRDAVDQVLLDKDELVKDERLDNLTAANSQLQRTLLRSEGLNRRLLSVVEKQAGLEAYRPQEEHEEHEATHEDAVKKYLEGDWEMERAKDKKAHSFDELMAAKNAVIGEVRKP